MPRVNFSDVDNYDKKKSCWLSLKDDGDFKLVMFPFKSIDELEIFPVHKVKLTSQTGMTYDRAIECLRNYNDPIDVCPLCHSGDMASLLYVIPLIDYNTGDYLLWSRNKTFFQELKANMENYPNFSSKVWKIIRVGKAGDKKTQYKMYPQDQMPPKDFSSVEVVPLLGNAYLHKEAQDMMTYLQTGEFPKQDTNAVPQGFTPIQQPMQQQVQPVMQQPMQQPQQMPQQAQGSRASANW